MNVPCYRGFNTFWYGDTWLNIENFISQYDSVSKKRKIYFTDNPNNFSDDISNKEHIISASTVGGWGNNIIVSKTADLIMDKTSGDSNYLDSYKWCDTSLSVTTTFVGGDSTQDSRCGLSSSDFTKGVRKAYSSYGFVKCCIIN